MLLKELRYKAKNSDKMVFFIFIWHAIFLGLTMSMLDFNTVFPSLVTSLVDSKIIFGFLYSIMLGAPLVFNIVFSHFMRSYRHKNKFLLLGIYLRALSFLGMAIFTYFFGIKSPKLVISSFFFLIFLFSISAGFAGIAYSDIIAKLLSSKQRGKLFATKQFASSIAIFVGGLIVARIFSPGSLAFPYNYALILFIGFLGLVIAALSFWLTKEPDSIIFKDEERESLIFFIKKVPDILRNDNNFFRFIIVENMTSFSLMILPFFMLFAKERFLIDESYVGKYLIFQIAGTILSNILWGMIANRFGAKILVRTCIFLGALIPIIAMIISPLGPNYFVIVFLLVGIIVSGRRVGFEPLLLDLAPNEQRTVYLGIRGSLNIFVVLLPIMGSIFIDLFGYYFTFILVSIIMFLAFYLLAMVHIKDEG
jgi:MFS family permease